MSRLEKSEVKGYCEPLFFTFGNMVASLLTDLEIMLAVLTFSQFHKYVYHTKTHLSPQIQGK